ncbi:MAG: hypothetical protein ACJAVK_000075 [Akkermansiaceae bacterium]|jgi:hypothetical protein
MGNLAQACDAFEEEYQALPLGKESTTDSPHSTPSENGNNLMSVLTAHESTLSENPKRFQFFDFKESRAKKDGLYRTKNGVELLDPWGNPYQVLLNYDYDDELQSPHDGKIIKDRRVLIWSTGPDGKQGTPETNKENIYS